MTPTHILGIVHIALIWASAITYITGAVLYAGLFHWERTTQGRATMTLMVAIAVILTLNVILAIVGPSPVWLYISVAAFALLTYAGTWWARTIWISRKPAKPDNFERNT